MQNERLIKCHQERLSSLRSDVREQFLKALPESDSLIHPGHEPGDNYYPLQMMKMITDYFLRKKERMEREYCPDSEINMFFITMMGFAVKCLFRS